MKQKAHQYSTHTAPMNTASFGRVCVAGVSKNKSQGVSIVMK